MFPQFKVFLGQGGGSGIDEDDSLNAPGKEDLFQPGRLHRPVCQIEYIHAVTHFFNVLGSSLKLPARGIFLRQLQAPLVNQNRQLRDVFRLGVMPHQKIPFKERFREEPSVDILLFQNWGILGSQESISLVTGMEEELLRCLLDSGKVEVLAEYGYEGMALHTVGLEKEFILDADHSRRGALKALFSGIHLMHGFQNTWGPHYTHENEPEGIQWFQYLEDLFRSLAISSPRHRNDLLAGDSAKALVLMDESSTRLAAYLPEGSDLILRQLPGTVKEAFALDPLNVNLVYH